MRLIDADAVDFTIPENPDFMIVLLMQVLKNVIDNAPTIDPESLRPQGEWVNWGKSGTPTYENYGTCCVCHEDAEIHTEHRNYCPSCGAYMKGGTHER